ncbi:MAG: hypothetical protein APF81_16680 [Desulfosporosinus sp. BRH_c37]|nr:MAG: hypothetical protein APF81_16680 [Desulfosporosinus sp. BRH_c37]
MIMFITMLLLLFAVAQWEKATLYEQATIVAEQVAATWDISSKELDTGNFILFEEIGGNPHTDVRYKNLYWRIFSDSSSMASSDEINPTGSLSQTKLRNAAEYLKKKGVTGTIRYDVFPLRTITVELHQNLGFNLKIPGMSDTIEAKAIAHVTEPAEFMRNIDMVLHYTSEFEKELEKYEKFKGPDK